MTIKMQTFIDICTEFSDRIYAMIELSTAVMSTDDGRVVIVSLNSSYSSNALARPAVTDKAVASIVNLRCVEYHSTKSIIVVAYIRYDIHDIQDEMSSAQNDRGVDIRSMTACTIASTGV
jgi:hypothetical protein